MTIDQVIQLFDRLRWMTGYRNGEVMEATPDGPCNYIRVAGMYRGRAILVEGRTADEVVGACNSHRYRIDYEEGSKLVTRFNL